MYLCDECGQACPGNDRTFTDGGGVLCEKCRDVAPDFETSCGLYGGHLHEIPKPHVRRFGPHSPAKRRVEIRLASWVGYAPGASHIQVSLVEEKNCIWNATERRWQEPWDDDEGRGRTFRNSFVMVGDYQRRVTEWVHSIVRRHFPPETHRVTDTNWCTLDTKRWVYREGD